MLPQKKAQLKTAIIILLYKLHDWNFDKSHKNYKESKYNADYFCKSDAFPVKDFLWFYSANVKQPQDLGVCFVA